VYVEINIRMFKYLFLNKIYRPTPWSKTIELHSIISALYLISMVQLSYKPDYSFKIGYEIIQNYLKDIQCIIPKMLCNKYFKCFSCVQIFKCVQVFKYLNCLNLYLGKTV